MAARDDSLCHLGLTPNPCAWDHVAAALARGTEGSRSNREYGNVFWPQESNFIWLHSSPR